MARRGTTPRCGSRPRGHGVALCSPTRREMPGRRWLPRPAAPCRHGHHLRRLCGLARLLARPTHTDLNGAELESTVPGILPNLGANARVTPPAAASSRRASAAGSPWRPRREGQLCSTASRQPWRRSRDDEREVDAMVEEAGSWRAQPSRTPSQRLGARRERATERDPARTERNNRAEAIA